MRDSLEESLVKRVSTVLSNTPYCWFFKVHGGIFQKVGIPDIIGCYHGKLFAMEMKKEKEEPTAIQKLVMCRIRNAGGVAGVVKSVFDAKRILEECTDTTKAPPN